MWDYTKSVIDHFEHPRNAGKLKDANAVGQVGSLACGDALKLFLKVDPKTEIIEKAKFQTFGCASAIASASALTELVVGKTLDQALAITNEEIADFLGGLPKQKMHCSVMGKEALEAAIANYRGEKIEEHKETEVLCKCFWVDEDKVRQNIRAHGLKTVEEVTAYTKAGGGCGNCIPDIKRILAEMNAVEEAPKKEVPRMTNLKRMQLVSKVIDEQIAPALRNDGGDIELLDVDGTEVYVSLRGACAKCANAKNTLKHLVEARLRETVDTNINVIEGEP
jgi:NifU-like protein